MTDTQDEMVLWANRSEDRRKALVRLAMSFDASEGEWSPQRAARVLAGHGFDLSAVLARLS